MVDGRELALGPGDEERSLLEVLRGTAGVLSAKDGCAPQGQCGCCTVLVDGAPRVACVTATRRVLGREVTTFDGLDPAVRNAWTAALTATGGSQCGFCTPGIVARLASGRAGSVADALLAHVCRCTGWKTIEAAAALVDGGEEAADGADGSVPAGIDPWVGRDRAAAERRATIEGGVAQRVGPEIAAGRGGFADDTAPTDALVAVLAPDGRWVVAETVDEARRAAGKVQGRRSTTPLRWPVEVPEGEWALTLQTTWVEPAYLEPDCSWCEPGGTPARLLANGGAFGGKSASPLPAIARRLADEHGRAVKVLLAREDVVRTGPKRPPLSAGVGADGRGRVRVARTPGIAAAIAAVAPDLQVDEVPVAGPPTSAGLRAAGWAEAVVLTSAATGADEIRAPSGAVAAASIGADGSVHVRVRCGDPLDAVVLRSYVMGAAHQALGWVRSEAIAVGDDGEVHDLTMRSFGILRARDTPPVVVEIEPDRGPPVNGSDAAFAAVALAAWRAAGLPGRWPVERR